MRGSAGVRELWNALTHVARPNVVSATPPAKRPIDVAFMAVWAIQKPADVADLATVKPASTPCFAYGRVSLTTWVGVGGLIELC
jgi:hypothetical protein